MKIEPKLEQLPVLEDKYILWDGRTLEKVIGLGTTARYNAIKEHGLPMPLKIGRKSFWRKSDILHWIDTREQCLDNLPIHQKGANHG